MQNRLGVGESTTWGESSSVWAKRLCGETYIGRNAWKPYIYIYRYRAHFNGLPQVNIIGSFHSIKAELESDQSLHRQKI